MPFNNVVRDTYIKPN